ncbi:MAG: hypothetical protein AAFR67_06380 [Chloroflexota bacterium]
MMSRTTLILLILSAPFWLGLGLVLWQRQPMLVIVPLIVVIIVSGSGIVARYREQAEEQVL